MKSKKLIAVIIGAVVSIFFYLVFGTVTAITPNRFFARMTTVGWLEHTSLIVTSLLLGIYVGLVYYGKSTKKDKVCNASATAGGIFGFLTFGCSICNKILVFLLGVTGIFTYFEPIRSYLGFVSIGLLGTAIFYKAKSIS